MFSQQQRGLWCHAAFATYQFIHPIQRNPQCTGQPGLRQLQRMKELLFQNRARMSRQSKFGKHSLLLLFSVQSDRDVLRATLMRIASP